MIKMNISRCIVGLLLALLLLSCAEDQLIQFSDKQGGIYFFMKSRPVGNYILLDTTYFSYIEQEFDEVTFPIRVNAMSLPSDIARPIAVKVDINGTTAEEGVHYKFDTENIQIKAGETGVSLNLLLLKDPSLLAGDVALQLKLEENEWFVPSPKESVIDPVNDIVADLSTHTIIVTVKAAQPLMWDKEVLGEFTTKKIVSGNKLLRLEMSIWKDPLFTVNDVKRWGNTLRMHLQNQAKKGEHILEDELFDKDGSNAKMWVPGITDWTEGEFKSE